MTLPDVTPRPIVSMGDAHKPPTIASISLTRTDLKTVAVTVNRLIDVLEAWGLVSKEKAP